MSLMSVVRVLASIVHIGRKAKRAIGERRTRVLALKAAASKILAGSVVAGTVAGAAEADSDTALVAGITYGGLVAIAKAIMTIVRVIKEARTRKREDRGEEE